MAQDVETGTVLMLGVTADIGRELTRRYLRDGWQVVGIGRSEERLRAIADEFAIPVIRCDLSDRTSIGETIGEVRRLGVTWHAFVSCAGTMEPIGPFFSTDFDAWEASIISNMCAQLRVLHGVWPQRRHGRIVDAILLAGGGTNGPFPNYSAYCVAKIALIKACELLDDENDDINAVAIGPGFVRTRIHDETIRAGTSAGGNLAKTQRFFETPGTSFDDIYGHVRWCMKAGRDVTGGRNFSTVHDPWRGDGEEVRTMARGNSDAFRLRRSQPRRPS